MGASENYCSSGASLKLWLGYTARVRRNRDAQSTVNLDGRSPNCLRRASCGRPSQQRLDYPPNVFREDALAGGIRMDAVPLIELGISPDAFQEERDQRRPVLSCDRAEDCAERADVIIAG